MNTQPDFSEYTDKLIIIENDPLLIARALAKKASSHWKNGQKIKSKDGRVYRTLFETSPPQQGVKGLFGVCTEENYKKAKKL